MLFIFKVSFEVSCWNFPDFAGKQPKSWRDFAPQKFDGPAAGQGSE